MSIILLQLCCKGTNMMHIYQGEYLSHGDGYAYSLTLKKDSLFTFKKTYFEVNSACQGKWFPLSKDTLVLECDEETNVLAPLEMDYMSERVLKFIILSKKSLRIEKTILTRQNLRIKAR